jgi:hypothetical protein
MLNEDAYQWLGLDRAKARAAIYAGKGDAMRYAESGQVRHLGLGLQAAGWLGVGGWGGNNLGRGGHFTS